MGSQVEGCSFRPKINAYSKAKPVKNKPGESYFDYLHRSNPRERAMKRSEQKTTEEKELEEVCVV